MTIAQLSTDTLVRPSGREDAPPTELSMAPFEVAVISTGYVCAASLSTSCSTK
jgi:hypothetical protein